MKDIILRHTFESDRYTDYVQEAFDITSNKIETNVGYIEVDRVDFDWHIGVIYGGSGSGKTSLLKTIGAIRAPKFSKTKTLISNFDFIEPKEATLVLASMGLSSVPSWLRPFHLLSNGEQYRAALAYLVASAKDGETILVDEYTSVVDRDVAKAMSNALQKYIRRTGKKIILASCHYDIMEWLLPDWVYSTNKRRIEKYECLRRPEIKLEVYRCRYEAWDLFKHHHYLTSELNPAAKCFLFTWNEKPVCFVAIMPLPSGWLENAFRVSRIVVLPDYQGLGIGFRANNYLAAIYKALGARYYIKTSNPAMGEAQLRSKDWKETTSSRKLLSDEDIKQQAASNYLTRKNGKATMANKNIFYSFEYVGNPLMEESAKNVVLFNADAYKDVAANQISLF